MKLPFPFLPYKYSTCWMARRWNNVSLAGIFTTQKKLLIGNWSQRSMSKISVIMSIFFRQNFIYLNMTLFLVYKVAL